MWPIGQTHKTTAASGLVDEYICKLMVLRNVAEPPAFLQTEKWKLTPASREFFVHRSHWRGPIAIFWCRGKTSCSVLNIGVCTNMTFLPNGQWHIVMKISFGWYCSPAASNCGFDISMVLNCSCMELKSNSIRCKRWCGKGCWNLFEWRMGQLALRWTPFTQYPTCDIVNLAETFGFNFPTIRQGDHIQAFYLSPVSTVRVGDV